MQLVKALYMHYNLIKYKRLDKCKSIMHDTKVRVQLARQMNFYHIFNS